MKRTTILTLILLLSFSIQAQIDSSGIPSDVEEGIFETLESQLSEEESTDYAEQLGVILEYQHKKVNLNALPAEVAYAVLRFNDYQYYQLQLYIEKYGELVTLPELAAVEGFTREDVERISAQVEVVPTKSRKSFFAGFFRRSQSSMLLRYGQIIEKQAGYDSKYSNPYLGNPLRLAFKYSFKTGENFAFGLTGEKDAGEQFFRGSEKQGFDHYAFFINIKNIGILKNCVLGDYMLDFGQGIIMGARSMGVKGGGAAQIRRFSSLLRPSAPMNESDNQHGIAAVVGNVYYNGTIFYSHRYYDGSLSPNGYHRTLQEVAAKHSLESHLAGGHFQLRRRIFELGITGTFMLFSPPISRPKELYKKFSFSGKELWNTGADYKVILRKTILFGEAAVSVVPETSQESETSSKDKRHPVGVGVLQGCILDLDPRSKLATLFRYYSRNFVSLNGSGFSSGNGSGEIGIYIAADFVTGRKTSLQFNFDGYEYQWLRFRVDKPCGGFDSGCKFHLNLSRYLSMQFQYQYYRGAQNANISDYYTSTTDYDKHKIHCLIHCNPTDWIQLKTEVDYLLNAGETNGYKQGFLLFQDVDFDFSRWNFGIKLRVAFFDTDSYNERIYAYEKDVLYTFTINGYYGKGIRYYLMLKYSYAFFDIQARLAQTFFDDRDSISSGQTLIQGKTKTEVRAQIIFHF